jgi:recombinational DNA repair ATPase RecF
MIRNKRLANKMEAMLDIVREQINVLAAMDKELHEVGRELRQISLQLAPMGQPHTRRKKNHFARWSKADEKFIRQHWNHWATKRIATRLCREVAAVRQHARTMGLSLRPKRNLTAVA